MRVLNIRSHYSLTFRRDANSIRFAAIVAITLLSLSFRVHNIHRQRTVRDDTVFAKNPIRDKTSTRYTGQNNNEDSSFDPFLDFVFRIPERNKQALFSTHHCVGTGNFGGTGFHQSEIGSHEQGFIPNFINRQCHYQNLYYRVKDQTFHYFASPSESTMLQEARKAAAKSAAGENNPNSEILFQRKQHEHIVEDGGKTMQTNYVRLNRDNVVADRDTTSAMLYDELVYQMNVQIGVPDFKAETFTVFQPWRPIVHEYNDTESTPLDFAILETDRSADFHFALYQPSNSFNIGHFIWDDLLTVFSLFNRLVLDRKPESGNDIVIPFFVELQDPKAGTNYGGHDNLWRCSPRNHLKWVNCVKTFSRLFETLSGVACDRCSGDLLRTGNWLRGDSEIGVWRGHPKNDSCLWSNDNNNSEETTEEILERQKLRNSILSAGLNGKSLDGIEYVMIPSVLAGGARLGMGNLGCNKDCALGRTNELLRFRNYLFRNIVGKEITTDNSADYKRGYILFSLPSHSSRPTEVYWFKREIEETIRRYGEGNVKAVDLSSISMKEQALLLDQTALLVTNHGGGSAAAQLLPPGSSVMLFWHGTRRLDHALFESVGYIRTTWIGVEERPFLNRTMSIIDHQYQQTLVQWSRLQA